MNDMKFTTAGDYMKTENESVESIEYDVVIDTLHKKHSELWLMTKRNLESEDFGLNIMDDIRLEQMTQLKEAMELWRKHRDGIT